MRLARLQKIDEDSRQDEEEKDQISESSYSNRVHELIASGDWSKLARVLATTQGIEMASEEIPFSGGDYPLHLLCDYTTNVKERQEIIEARMELHQRQVEKFKAWEERQRRRIRGEDVATVYDSDEWTSSDESEGGETITTLNSDKTGTQTNSTNSMPPTSVVCAMLQAYPLAAKKRGFGGRLPLHHVVRHDFPLEVIEAVLKSYPEGRTCKDKQERSPYDLMEVDNDTLEIQAILCRPTSCWVHGVEEERLSRTLDQDLTSLEQDIKKLKEELDESKAEEERLYGAIESVYNSCIDIEKRRDQDQGFIDTKDDMTLGFLDYFVKNGVKAGNYGKTLQDIPDDQKIIFSKNGEDSRSAGLGLTNDQMNQKFTNFAFARHQRKGQKWDDDMERELALCKSRHACFARLDKNLKIELGCGDAARRN